MHAPCRNRPQVLRMKRIADIVLALTALLAAIPLGFIIGLVIRITSAGPVFHWSQRVGENNRIFLMPKFRTMRIDTPQVATHLLTDSHAYITRFGMLLRRTSLDELPQLYSVLRGDMSIVGPRPALFNQHDLVALRTQQGAHYLRPGITGWAQINGRDELSIEEKVRFDVQYAADLSFVMDLKILWLTLLKVATREGVRQADEAPARRAA